MGSEFTRFPLKWLGTSTTGLVIAIFILCGWTLSVCLHEFGHAMVAYLGGDTTVRHKGYLTLNPLKYTDLSYSLIYPLIFLMLGGIALPGAAVYINTPLLRNRSWRSAVSAAGPIATGIVAMLLATPFHLGLADPDQWIWHGLACLASFQVVALCFNLLPVPSLDGFGIIEPWLPPVVQRQMRRWRRYGFLAILAILWFIPPARHAFWTMVRTLSQWLGIPPDLIHQGYSLFQQSSKTLFLVVIVTVLIFQKQFRRPQSEAGQNAPATENLTDSLAAYDHAIKTGTHSAEVWNGRGSVLGELGRYEEAVSSYDRALSYEADNPDSWHNRALALYALGQYEQALSSSDQAMKLGSTGSEDWYFHGLLLSQLDRYEEAIASFDQALKIEPNDPLTWYHRGLASYWLGDCDKAIADYDRAVYLKPDFDQAWFRRGLVLNKLQQYPRALACFDHALEIQSDNAAAWAAKGLALLQMDQYEAAIVAHERSVKLDPNDAHAWYNKACCHAHQGQIQSALNSLKQAVQLNPEPTRELASTDPDLQRLCQEPTFQQLING